MFAGTPAPAVGHPSPTREEKQSAGGTSSSGAAPSAAIHVPAGEAAAEQEALRQVVAESAGAPAFPGFHALGHRDRAQRMREFPPSTLTAAPSAGRGAMSATNDVDLELADRGKRAGWRTTNSRCRSRRWPRPRPSRAACSVSEIAGTSSTKAFGHLHRQRGHVPDFQRRGDLVEQRPVDAGQWRHVHRTGHAG